MALRGEPDAFQAGVQLRPGDPEERRGSRFVALHVLQGGENGAPFQVGQRLGRRPVRCLAACAIRARVPRPVQAKMGRREQAPIGEDEAALDGVRQLPDVPGPGMGEQEDVFAGGASPGLGRRS